MKFNTETGDYLQYIYGSYDQETKFFYYLQFISAQGETFESGFRKNRDRIQKIKNLHDEVPICLNLTCCKLIGKRYFMVKWRF